MSSNTLRGVGQDGGGGDRGDGNGENGSQQQVPGSEPGRLPGAASATERPGETGGTDRMAELRNIRSLDSTVPGTRSLDSSVPDAQPSLDDRVPSLAATMLGMTAPSIPKREAGPRGGSREPAGREQGTVQGRDVHLPVELQRRAGVIAVPGSSLPTHQDAAPAAVDRSEPTIADPVRAPHGTREVISHGPWYEQEPAGADAYDPPKPNLIGRVAIGAAIAASLSVVLFAIVRVRAQNAAQEAESLQVQAPLVEQAAPPAPTPEPAAPAAAAPPQPPYPGELRVDPAGAVPSQEIPSDRAAAAATLDERTVRTPDKTGAAPRTAASTQPQGRSRSSGTRSVAGSDLVGAPNRADALPANLFRPKALGDSQPSVPTTPPPIEASSAAATGTAAPTSPAEASPTQAPSARPALPGDAPGPGARSRPNKTDDPDSTLPLNVD